MTAAAKKAAGPVNSRKSRTPRSAQSEDEGKSVNVLEALPPKVAVPQKRSPYPDHVQTFAYQPEAGGEPILLPLNGFEQPDKVWHFDVAQMPPLAQTWAWMRKVGVPKDIQRRACALPDPEYFAMFDKWFEVMRAFLKVGPAGAVTSGK